MKDFKNTLKNNKEYYFYFSNYFCTGFFLDTTGEAIHLTNGHFYIGNEMHAYDEAYIKLDQIVAFAST